MCNVSAILREKILSCFLTNAFANSGGIQSDTIWKRQNCTIGNHRRDMFCMPVLLVSMLIACTSQFGREFGREFVWHDSFLCNRISLRMPRNVRDCVRKHVQETKNAFDNAFLECFCVEACIWNGSKSIQMQECLCENCIGTRRLCMGGPKILHWHRM